jgi:hypothetical protein
MKLKRPASTSLRTMSVIRKPEMTKKTSPQKACPEEIEARVVEQDQRHRQAAQGLNIRSETLTHFTRTIPASSPETAAPKSGGAPEGGTAAS